MRIYVPPDWLNSCSAASQRSSACLLRSWTDARLSVHVCQSRLFLGRGGEHSLIMHVTAGVKVAAAH